MKNTSVNLTEDSVLKAISLFALPILISNVFQQLYNTADTMIVGNYFRVSLNYQEKLFL